MNGWQKYELVLLALVLWREARGEGAQGMLGVACSIINRVKHPGWWGSDLAGVITKKWQYSSITDPQDPQLTRFPIGNDPSFLAALDVAEIAIGGQFRNPVGEADSYHDVSIEPPKWATDLCFVTQIGRLKFYKVR
jgi:N-acetylmuramoyl-L-alanine amidase